MTTDRREALAAFERLAAVAKLLPDATYEDYSLVKSALAADQPALDVDVRPELVQWFHDGVEQCEHDYEPPPCEIDADALLESFTVEPRIYENADGTFRYQREHFGRLHRARLAREETP